MVLPLSWVALAGLVVAPARAEDEVVSVWYRSSEGCPNGDEFVKRLAALGRAARLAGAGDHIDFVVTLGANQPKSEGRLERQTASGTVAIREVQAESCQQVSEALALSLDLALGPRSQESPSGPQGPEAPRAREPTPTTPSPPAPAPTAAPTPAPDEPASPAPPQTPPLSESATRTRTTAPTPTAAPSQSKTAGPNFGIGLEGTVRTGTTPEPMPGIAALVELGGERYDSPSGRLFFGVSRSDKDDLAFLLWAGRLEGCTPLAGSRNFRLGPCIQFELGALNADYSAGQGGTDTGFWGALGAAVLVGSRVNSSVALEAQLGGHVPLKRYRTIGNDGELFRTRSLGFFAGLGVVWLPE